MRVLHLRKSGSGMASKTACGRNVLRTAMSTDWKNFNASNMQCELCRNSKQAALCARLDVTIIKVGAKVASKQKLHVHGVVVATNGRNQCDVEWHTLDQPVERGILFSDLIEI